MATLRGALTLLVLLGARVGALPLATLIAARALGAGRFRWFSPEPMPVSAARRWAVRAVGNVAPLLTQVLFATAVMLVLGAEVPTSTVHVLDGPARAAGLRDGDRIVSVDGVVSDDWDTLRSALQAGSAERHVEVERDGRRQTFRVTRDAGGRIGVVTVTRRVPIGVGAAIAGSVGLQMQALGVML